MLLCVSCKYKESQAKVRLHAPTESYNQLEVAHQILSGDLDFLGVIVS